ncbi:MAG: hypothetical protein ABSE48_15510 [Verrucomicrobiota bacterium]|jgi:hypothetical protein
MPDGPGHFAMKFLSQLLNVVLVLFLELVILEVGEELLFGRSHGAMADVVFRRHERLDAFNDWHTNPSPATKSRFDEEMRLMHKHEEWKYEVAWGLFVVLNGVGIYYYFHHGHERRRT